MFLHVSIDIDRCFSHKARASIRLTFHYQIFLSFTVQHILIRLYTANNHMGISWTGQPRADRGVNYMVIFFSFFKYRGTGVLSFAFDFCYRSKVFSSETLFFFIVMVVTYNTIVFRLRDLRLQLGFCLLQLFMLIKLLCFSRPFISVVWPKSTNDFEPLRRVTHRPFAQKRRSPPVKNVYKKRGTVEKENGHNTKKKENRNG